MPGGARPPTPGARRRRPAGRPQPHAPTSSVRRTGRQAAGDFDAYAAELAEALERRPEHPGLLYVLACAEALASRPDAAIEHLRRALELCPELTDAACGNEDFASIRDRPDWPLAAPR